MLSGLSVGQYVSCLLLFFLHDTAPTEIYTLSLHDALPISDCAARRRLDEHGAEVSLRDAADRGRVDVLHGDGDRKSTRLNSSHGYISYAVFCLKKKTAKHARHSGCSGIHTSVLRSRAK